MGYDRPGYGASTAKPGYAVADGADDVRAIAATLGIDRLVVWGFSGGGPYALACAALLPDLIPAAAVIGAVAPWDAPGLDYFAGMGEDNVEDARLYFSDREAARRKAGEDREQMLSVTAEQLTDALQSLLSPVDAEALTGEFAEQMAESIHTGLDPGDQGWWDDGVASMSPWGFDLSSIRIPVKVWHGRQDRFVPFQHGQWLAEHIPGAESAFSDGDGHLSLLIEKVGDVHEWLLSHW
jgi:pimeloyl-ACP methyl ester carboxylesterase